MHSLLLPITISTSFLGITIVNFFYPLSVFYLTINFFYFRDNRYENYNPELTQPQPELLGAILQGNPLVFRQQQQHQQWNANQSSITAQQQQQSMLYNSQQHMGYSSPATHVGAYTPSGNVVQV